jgi:hypothetical protein
LRTDNTLDHGNSNFYRFTGTTWVTLESLSGPAGDVGIFANYGTNAIHTKPVVAAVNPGNGTVGVSRAIQEIELQFDKEMTGNVSAAGGASWTLSGSTPIRWSSDLKTCFISRDNGGTPLPAGTQIQITLNGSGHNPNFMDIFGNTLDPYALSFTTGP